MSLTTRPDHGTPIGHLEGKPVTGDDFYQIFFDELEQKLNQKLLGEAIQFPTYTKTTLPSASDNFLSGKFSSLIFVSDDVGGAVFAFSDGTDWRRVTDRAVIS